MMGGTDVIINALTGESLRTNVHFFITFDEFLNFIVSKWRIPRDKLLIILPFGQKLDASNFAIFLRQSNDSPHLNQENKETEFYVFFESLFALPSEPLLQKNNSNGKENHLLQCKQALQTMLPAPTLLVKPIESPLVDETFSNGTSSLLDSHKIISLLTTNLGWLSALEIDVYYLIDIIKSNIEQVKLISKCALAYHSYLKFCTFEISKLYDSNLKYYNDLHQNGVSFIENWKNVYNNLLNRLSVFRYSIHKTDSNNDKDDTDSSSPTLQSFISIDILQKADNDIVKLEIVIKNNFEKIKDSLNTCKKYEGTILEEVNCLQGESQKGDFSRNAYQCFDENTLKDFKSKTDSIRNESRDILDKSSYEFSEEYIESISNIVQDMKDNRVNNLYSFSKQLYENSTRLLELKLTLQSRLIDILGQTAFIQNKILQVKHFILNECNKNLQKYQSIEIEFAHLEDLPIIYGLYIIESYRRGLWMKKCLQERVANYNGNKRLLEDEMISRNKWMKTFGPIASNFCEQEFKNNRDLKQLLESSFLNYDQNNDNDVQNKITDKIHLLENKLQRMLEFIKKYLLVFENCSSNKDVIDVLRKKLVEADAIVGQKQKLEIDINSSLPESEQANIIKSYKSRIQRLESLLHESKYSNANHWPSALLNEDGLKQFVNNKNAFNGQPVSENVSATGNNMTSETFLHRETLLNEQIVKLKESSNKLQEELDRQKTKTNATHSKLVDMELERAAYKETLANLNHELSRLTSAEENLKGSLLEEKLKFSRQIQDIIDEYRDQLESRESTQNPLNSQEVEKEYISELETKNEELSQKEKEWEIQRQKYENELIELKNEHKATIKELSEENETLKSVAQQDIKDAIQQEKEVYDDNISTVTNRLISYQDELFDIFKSNIFILENIGLLLVSKHDGDQSQKMEIKRVKGLRKNMGQSILDESAQLIISPDDKEMIQSDVYGVAKTMIERETENNLDILMTRERIKFPNAAFLDYVKELYTQKFYEQAVIRRFNDIETLAKKLTKENKSKRAIIDKFKNEKITLKDFQIGDLALFLRTNDYSNKVIDHLATISSLTSSFSSVDLSTPPLQPRTPTLFVEKTEDDSSVKKSNISDDRNPNPILLQKHTWAAFTAFEDETRYFLKFLPEKDGILGNSDWFIGKITSIEAFNVNNDTSVKDKTSNATPYYQVTANLVTAQ